MKNKYIFPVLILFSATAISGMEDRRFESERLVLVKKIRKILIDRRVCSSVATCQGIYFVSPYPGGVSIQLWGIKDEVAVRNIAQECNHLFFRLNRKINLVIGLYKETKEESLNKPFWKFNNAIMTIEYK